MTVKDLREVDNGDELTITTESGEEFTAMVTGHEHDPSDNYTKGYVRCNFEDGLWEQVKDRVDSEVLDLRQTYARKSGRLSDTELYGTVWPEPAETSEPEYVSMGEVESVEVV